MKTNHLDLGLDKQLAPSDLLAILKRYYPNTFFENMDDPIKNDFSSKKSDGSFQFYSGLQYERFTFKIDINLPVTEKVTEEAEIIIAVNISKTHSCGVVVSGDFYDEVRFPHTWIIIDGAKCFEAIETDSRIEGLERYEVVGEIEINTTAFNT